MATALSPSLVFSLESRSIIRSLLSELRLRAKGIHYMIERMYDRG